MQANSGDHEQTPNYVASDLGLHYLPMSHKKDAMHICAKMQLFCLSHKSCRIVEIIFLVKVRTSDLSKGSLTVWALYAYFSDSQNAAFELLVWCM